MNEKKHTASSSYLDATGPIAVTLRNDMMFHRAMQSSNVALKGLICALKGLDPKDIKEVIITNPIDYSAYAKKEVVLDVKVLMNDSEILDIELQLYYDKHWEKRSLLYLCRAFDSIGISDKYEDLKKTTLIVITDHPKKGTPKEFYAHHLLLNTKTFLPYSALLNLDVLYLKEQGLATDEDIKNGLLYWARLFEASTWEELRSLITIKPEMEEVAKTMYNSNVIQDQEKTLFEAHQKFLDMQHALYASGYSDAKEEDQKVIDDLTSKNEMLAAEIERLNALVEKTKLGD